MFPSNIIKPSRTECELWAAQDFSSRVHKYIINKVIVVSLAHAYWSLPMPVLNVIKIFQTTENFWSAQENGLEIRSGEITRKKKNTTRVLLIYILLDLIHVPIKQYQIISNCMGVKACIRFRFRGDNYITKRVIVVSLAHGTLSGPYLNLYQIL